MQSETEDTTFSFTDPDGYEIFVYRWGPPAGVTVKAVVQVEHGPRNTHCAMKGWPVSSTRRDISSMPTIIAAIGRRRDDGKSRHLRAGRLGRDGRDAKQLTDIIKENHPGLPVFLFGHSMGSMMAQQYIQNWGEGLAAQSCVARRGVDGGCGRGSCGRAGGAREAANQPSELFMGLFASVNAPFEPVKTPFDWLSRDEAEVQKYIDDPWCGFIFSNGMTYEFLKGMVNFFDPANEARIPKGSAGLCHFGRDGSGRGEQWCDGLGKPLSG